MLRAYEHLVLDGARVKRCDRWRREYLRRIAIKRARRRNTHRQRKAYSKRVRCERFTIRAPAWFTIDNADRRSKLLSFLSKLRMSVKKHKHVVVDFTNTQRMVASGTLLFRAELCRLRNYYHENFRLRCIPPSKPKVAQVLKQVGVYRLMNYKSSVRASASDVVKWRHANGHQAVGAQFDTVLGDYDGVIPVSLVSGLYRGVTEAMVNCCNHAYISTREDGLSVAHERSDWWMFSQERDNRLTVVFCDLGIGIPRSLPRQKPKIWESILAKVQAPKDSEIIGEAVKESMTRTGKSYRGRGLSQLVAAVKNVDGGYLAIYSNHGKYHVKGDVVTMHNYDDSILGTLIEWSIPVRG